MSTHAIDYVETQDRIAENITTTLHRAGRMKQQALALAVGISPQTLSRRMNGQQPWLFWEVQAIADYFTLTLGEITTDLPSREEWQVRWSEVVRHQGLEPRTR